MKSKLLILSALLLLATGPALVAQDYGQPEQPSESPDVDVDASAEDIDVDATSETDADTMATGEEDQLGEEDQFGAEEDEFGDETLPATASDLPLVGLMGLAALALAGTLRFAVRRK